MHECMKSFISYVLQLLSSAVVIIDYSVRCFLINTFHFSNNLSNQSENDKEFYHSFQENNVIFSVLSCFIRSPVSNIKLLDTGSYIISIFVILLDK